LFDIIRAFIESDIFNLPGPVSGFFLPIRPGTVFRAKTQETKSRNPFFHYKKFLNLLAAINTYWKLLQGAFVWHVQVIFILSVMAFLRKY